MKFNDLMTLHYFKNIYYKMAQMMFKVTPWLCAEVFLNIVEYCVEVLQKA